MNNNSIQNTPGEADPDQPIQSVPQIGGSLGPMDANEMAQSSYAAMSADEIRSAKKPNRISGALLHHPKIVVFVLLVLLLMTGGLGVFSYQRYQANQAQSIAQQEGPQDVLAEVPGDHEKNYIFTINGQLRVTGAGAVATKLTADSIEANRLMINGATIVSGNIEAGTISGSGAGLTGVDAARLSGATLQQILSAAGSNRGLQGSGQSGQLAYFGGDGGIQGSIMTQDGFSVTVGGALQVEGDSSIVGNINTKGTVTATRLQGDGSGLTNLNANAVGVGLLAANRGGTGNDGTFATNGTLLIGNGSGYSLAKLLQGSGVNIVNGSGSISIGVDNTICTTAGNCALGAGSPDYIQNTTVQQAANFNIAGNGVIGGQLTVTGAVMLNDGQTITNVTAGNVAVKVIAAAGQTANLFQLENNAGQTLGGFNAAGQLYSQSGSFSGTLAQAVLSANRTYTLSDESGVICLQGSNNCGFAGNGGTSSGYIQNQSSIQQATSMYWISGSGRADVSLLTPQLDTAIAGALGIGTTTATALNIARTGVTTTVGGSLIVDGQLTANNTLTLKANSATASILTLTDSSGEATVEMRTGAASDKNLFIGIDSGISNTAGSGSNNIALGHTALQSNTTGRDSLAIGTGALNRNTTGDGIAIGVNALANSVTTFSNVAIGQYAMQEHTSGSYNVAIGYAAGYGGTAKSNSTAVGASSLQSNNGASNSAYGFGAIGGAAGSGNSNSAFGVFSLYGLSNGTGNVAMGRESLYRVNTGNTNTALGNESGYNVTNGSGNVFLGYRAGYNETGSNKLYIANSNTSAPLVQGDFSAATLVINGTLTVTQAVAFDGALTAKSATFNGTLSINGHIVTGNTTGTTTATAGAASCSAPTVTVTGNDTAGIVSLTSGTGACANGELVITTFANAYGTAPVVILTPRNAESAALQYYVSDTSTTSFSISTNAVPSASTAYEFGYHVLQ